MRPLALAFLVAIGLTFAVAAMADERPDPCAGHVTPDGIHADAMGPCDEMPAVP